MSTDLSQFSWLKKLFLSFVTLLFCGNVITTVFPYTEQSLNWLVNSTQNFGFFYHRNFSLFTDHKTDISSQQISITTVEGTANVVDIISPTAQFRRSYLPYFLEYVFSANDTDALRLRPLVAKYLCDNNGLHTAHTDYATQHVQKLKYEYRKIKIDRLREPGVTREGLIRNAPVKLLYFFDCVHR